MKVVFDTDVVVAGIVSPSGASRRWLRAALQGEVRPVISVPMVLEYEMVLKRPEIVARSRLRAEDIDRLLDTIVAAAELVDIAYLWRPFLRDPADEMVLEAAVNGAADWLITFNLRDFSAAKQFGINVSRPGAAWRQWKGMS